MSSIYRVYFTPYNLTKADADPINSFAVTATSKSWFSSAGISTARGAPQIPSGTVTRLQNVIYADLMQKARELRFLENSLNRAYGRNRAGLIDAIKSGKPEHNKIGLTFNGRTYKRLYTEYLTLMEAVSFTSGILRSYSRVLLR
jgi:hypothetical protein